jgi:hypothetical protein
MGIVYRTQDTKSEWIVALRSLPKHLSRGKTATNRISDKTNPTSALDHPMITIYGMAQSECSIHTEHVEGKPIKQLMFVTLTSQRGQGNGRGATCQR